MEKTTSSSSTSSATTSTPKPETESQGPIVKPKKGKTSTQVPTPTVTAAALTSEESLAEPSQLLSARQALEIAGSIEHHTSPIQPSVETSFSLLQIQEEQARLAQLRLEEQETPAQTSKKETSRQDLVRHPRRKHSGQKHHRVEASDTSPQKPDTSIKSSTSPSYTPLTPFEVAISTDRLQTMIDMYQPMTGIAVSLDNIHCKGSLGKNAKTAQLKFLKNFFSKGTVSDLLEALNKIATLTPSNDGELEIITDLKEIIAPLNSHNEKTVAMIETDLSASKPNSDQLLVIRDFIAFSLKIDLIFVAASYYFKYLESREALQNNVKAAHHDITENKDLLHSLITQLEYSNLIFNKILSKLITHLKSNYQAMSNVEIMRSLDLFNTTLVSLKEKLYSKDSKNLIKHMGISGMLEAIKPYLELIPDFSKSIIMNMENRNERDILIATNILQTVPLRIQTVIKYLKTAEQQLNELESSK